MHCSSHSHFNAIGLHQKRHWAHVLITWLICDELADFMNWRTRNTKRLPWSDCWTG
jgi:hypothetical protein